MLNRIKLFLGSVNDLSVPAQAVARIDQGILPLLLFLVTVGSKIAPTHLNPRIFPNRLDALGEAVSIIRSVLMGVAYLMGRTKYYEIGGGIIVVVTYLGLIGNLGLHPDVQLAMSLLPFFLSSPTSNRAIIWL